MAVSFGGLATGMDTNSIVSQLMQLERRPITRLEGDKIWHNNRISALTELDTTLQGFLDKIDKLDSETDLRATATSLSSKDYFTATGSDNALPGNYEIEVVDLAQVQKSVTQGFVDKTASSFGGGTLSITVGAEVPVDIVIDNTNNSLEGVVAAINNADAGVSAAIINDGTGSPYRMVITGDDVATSFSLSSTLPGFNGDVTSLETGGYLDQTAQLFGSGTLSLSTGHDITLTGPTSSLDDMRDTINAETLTTGVSAITEADGNGGFKLTLTGGTISSTNLTGGSGNDAFSLTQTQTAQQAHVQVDNIDIYSQSNTLSEAIPGVTLNLTKAEVGTKTSLNVSLDNGVIESKINDFISGYNEVMTFISSQSVTNGSTGGILGGDMGMNVVKRNLQDLLTTRIGGTGSLSALSQLGLETQKDGTLILDSNTLSTAVSENLDDVVKLLAGETDIDGIATRVKAYLEDITDSTDGFLAGRKESIQASITQVDEDIEMMEMRLEKREETMRNKFNALELLMSSMNSQSTFLTQQMDLLNNMMTGNK